MEITTIDLWNAAVTEFILIQHAAKLADFLTQKGLISANFLSQQFRIAQGRLIIGLRYVNERHSLKLPFQFLYKGQGLKSRSYYNSKEKTVVKKREKKLIVFLSLYCFCQTIAIMLLHDCCYSM